MRRRPSLHLMSGSPRSCPTSSMQCILSVAMASRPTQPKPSFLASDQASSITGVVLSVMMAASSGGGRGQEGAGSSSTVQ